MKKLILCLLIHIILVKGDWETLISPIAGGRGTLVGTFSRCEEGNVCEVISAWSNGDILAVDTQTHNVKSYHSASNPTGIPAGQQLTAVAFSPQSNTIFVATSATGTTVWFYYMDLDFAGLPNAWSVYTAAATIAAGAYPVSLIPLDNAQSSEVLVQCQNGVSVVVNPFYTTTASGVIQNSPSFTPVPKQNQVVDLMTGVYPYILDQRGFLTASALGTVYFTPFNTTQPTITIASPVVQLIAQTLTYRANGTLWIILAQSSATGSTPAGYLTIYDMVTKTVILSTQTSPVALTILPDLELNDWLVVAQANGAIVKYNLATIKISPTPLTIVPPDSLHTFSDILSIHSNWMPVNGFNGTQILPVLIVVSKSGEITTLPSGSSHWETLLSPTDLEDPNAKIVDLHFVQLSFDNYIDYGVPAYQMQVTLDNGHVLAQLYASTLFTSGSPSLTSGLISVRQYDYAQGSESRQIRGEASTQVGILSFNEICSLIQMNAEIVIQLFSAKTGESIELRIVGYEISSDPSRTDVQNVILLPQLNTTQQAIGWEFWTPEEISQGFDTLLAYYDVGKQIFDFVWTLTSLFL